MTPTAETAAEEFGPGWYAATAEAVPECRILASDLDVDVCVVGGGIAGLTIAHELGRHGWSVAVLDAGRIGVDEAGVATGIVAPGFSLSPQNMIARVGVDRARELWRLSEAGVARIRASVGESGFAGVSPGAGVLAVASENRGAEVLQRAECVRETFGGAAEFWPTEKVRETLRSSAMHQAVYLPNALHVHPLNYLLGLAAAARGVGVRVYERTAVRAVDASGIRKQADAVGGRVRARHIVLAAPGDLGALHPSLAGTVMPLAFPVGVSAPLGPALADVVRFPGAVTTGLAAGSHRIVGGDRLMWTGALTARFKPPRRLGEHLRREVLFTYPQLAELAIEHTWHARADYAVHRMPQIGELAPGLWLAAAFGAHGMARAVMAADLIAGAIREGDDRWRLFQSFGLVWTGGRAGRALVGAALGARRARAALRRDKPLAAATPPHQNEPEVPPPQQRSSA